MAAVVAIEEAVCECCGLREECTPAYVSRVKERFYEKFLCGLCAEAVKDELCRSGKRIGMEEALQAHMAFCAQFRVEATASNPALCLVGAVRQLLKRSLVASSVSRSAPASPRIGGDSPPAAARISRTGSCLSTLAR